MARRGSSVSRSGVGKNTTHHSLLTPGPPNSPRSPNGFLRRGLGGVRGLPGVEAAFERRRFEAQFVEPPRRPGAGRFVRSGTVSGDGTEAGFPVRVLGVPARRPVLDRVRRHPDAAGDAGEVPLVLRAGAYVEDDRRVRSLQLLGEPVGVYTGRLFRGPPSAE